MNDKTQDAARTQVADARPVADAREALTDSVVEGWLDRQGNDSGQGLCDMYTSAVRDGFRLARSTLTNFYATRGAVPTDASLDALRRIKILVCGDSAPLWNNAYQTSISRGMIADIIDETIAASVPREKK